MTTTAEYVQAIRDLTPTGSVYAAARLLDMNEDTFRSYSLGRHYPDALACVKIALALGLPVEKVLADVHAEREANPERAAFWRELANEK